MWTSLKKASLCGAFFVSLICFSPPSSSADCQPAPNTRAYEVAAIVDGDTLRLENGKKVRLIGIDTPELGRDGEPDAPYAREASSAMEKLVQSSASRVYLQLGRERRDRHRRLLGHVYSSQGQNLTAELLKKGLGYQAVVAPNISNLSCYREAERYARERGLGLWSRELPDAVSMGKREPGFHLLRGVVESVGSSRDAVWLNLRGEIAVKVPQVVWREMTNQKPADFEGRRLEVRGWFYRHKGRLRLTLSHQAAIRWL